MGSPKTTNTRPYWRYVKSQRQDSFGIPPLKRDGVLHTDSKTKAAIMLDEFKSVFTQEYTSFIPQLNGPAFPHTPRFVIHKSGVDLLKLLQKLDPNKATGPDNIPCRLLLNLSTELAPVITALISQSLETGTVPKDWTSAVISPIYNKGDVHLATNYRPISLTCVVCKVMEHILSKHILDHLDKQQILTLYQHVFLKAHFCESQLLVTLDNLMATYDRRSQVDIGVLDFSRAFDTVPHARLLGEITALQYPWTNLTVDPVFSLPQRDAHDG